MKKLKLMMLSVLVLLSMGAVNANEQDSANTFDGESALIDAPSSSETKDQEESLEKKNTGEASAEAPAEAPAEAETKEKPAPLGLLGWIRISIEAATCLLALVLTVLVIAMRGKLRRISENTQKGSDLEKTFKDKIRCAIDEAVREKNPILQDYEELSGQNEALTQELLGCRNELQETRTAYENTRREEKRLSGELADAADRLNALQQDFDDCSKALEQERNTTESLRGTVGRYRSFVGQEIDDAFEIEKWESEPRMRGVVLGLAKMNAMRDSGVDTRNILRDFQTFDMQFNAFFRDPEEMQRVRERIKPVVEKLLNHEYLVSWPRIGSNISEYNRKEELDLDESESGTTIKAVKCATIRFADADHAAFQKAKVICD